MLSKAITTTLDQALSTPGGITLDFTSKAAATNWRMQAYAVRRRDIAQSRSIYPPEHPSHNTSPYEHLTIKFVPPTSLAITTLEPPPVIRPLLAPGERPIKPESK